MALRALMALPVVVLGPVLAPPWYLHRPFRYCVPLLRQGFPERVCAPQSMPMQDFGNVGILASPVAWFSEHGVICGWSR